MHVSAEAGNHYPPKHYYIPKKSPEAGNGFRAFLDALDGGKGSMFF